MKCPICLANRGTLGVLRYDEVLNTVRQHNIDEHDRLPELEDVTMLMQVRSVLLGMGYELVNSSTGKFWGWDKLKGAT